MEYSLLILLIIIIPLALFFNYNRRLRERVLHKILERHLLKERPKNAWYSSVTVRRAAAALNKLSGKKLQPLLAAVRRGETAPLLAKVDSQTADELKAIRTDGKAKGGNLQQAETALLNLETTKAARLLKRLEANNKTERARLDYLQAWLALSEGDLLTASTKAAAAVRQFQKLDFIYEEAQAYLLSGTIYRVSAVTDTAEFMLRTAAELFGLIGADARQAEALGNLGMLMVMENRFEEADDYFARAQKLYQAAKDETGFAEIINQQALTALIRGQHTAAAALSGRARKVFQTLHDPRGQALSLDIAAQTAAAAGDWKKAAAAAKLAQKLYRQNKNLPAQQEMELLLAQALLEENRPAEAEKILRQIIENARRHKSCFHVANAYNLLGIIYLRQGDLRRAEGLFQQSLSAEVQNERWCGAAIDYANIALTSYRRGHKDDGDKYRALALQYARDAGETQLAEIWEKKLV